MQSYTTNSTSMPSTDPMTKKTRLATGAASSGGPHGDAWNMVDKVESFSSTVAQFAAAKTQLFSTDDRGRWPMEFKKFFDGMLAGEIPAEQKICMLVVEGRKPEQ